MYSAYTPKVMVNATLRYSYTGNGISAYSFFDENNLLNTTYGNIVTSQSTGLNAYMMLNPTNKTRIMINGGSPTATSPARSSASTTADGPTT